MKRKHIVITILLGALAALLILSPTIFPISTPFPGLRQLPVRVSIFDLDRLLSPDGTWLISKSSMTTAELKSTDLSLGFELISTMVADKAISVPIPGEAFSIAGWSPDGSAIAVLVNTVTQGNVCFHDEVILLKLVDASRIEQTIIPIPSELECVSALWSPDGSMLLLSPKSNRQHMLFYDLHGQQIGSYLPSVGRSGMWWTDRGLYIYARDTGQCPIRFLGDMYLLNPATFTAQKLTQGIVTPLFFSPSGDRLVTLDPQSEDEDVLQIRDTITWEVKKPLPLPGKVTEMPGDAYRISRVTNAPQVTFTLETMTRRAALFDWDTEQVLDCGNAAEVIGWRSNVQSALAVRGLGSMDGHLAWFRIPAQLDPIPVSSCRVIGG